MGRPAVPNLVPVAQEQGEINRGAAMDVAQQNRYSQYGPEGSSNVWGTDPTTGVATNTTTMGARPEAYYNALMGGGTTAAQSFADKYYGGGAGSAPAGGGMASITIGGMPQGNNNVVNKGIQKDLDYSGLTAMPGSDIGVARQQAQDALYGRSAGYLDPQWEQSEAATRSRLSSQGLVPGTTAYNRAYANEAAAKEKAYTGARQDAIAGGGAEAERAQAMALQLRNQGVTEAGNLGAFHNAAQEQGARQFLTQRGQDTTLSGQLGSASISAGASMANNAADNALRLRQQEYAEATGLGKQAQDFLPQFGISQGNVGKYAPADVYGATQQEFQDAMERYKAKKPSFLQQMALAAAGNAGQAARAYGGGGGGTAPASGGAAP